MMTCDCTTDQTRQRIRTGLKGIIKYESCSGCGLPIDKPEVVRDFTPGFEMHRAVMFLEERQKEKKRILDLHSRRKTVERKSGGQNV